jgi:hypothetical protein
VQIVSGVLSREHIRRTQAGERGNFLAPLVAAWFPPRDLIRRGFCD